MRAGVTAVISLSAEPAAGVTAFNSLSTEAVVSEWAGNRLIERYTNIYLTIRWYNCVQLYLPTTLIDNNYMLLN